jgi:hypothetical protein
LIQRQRQIRTDLDLAIFLKIEMLEKELSIKKFALSVTSQVEHPTQEEEFLILDEDDQKLVSVKLLSGAFVNSLRNHLQKSDLALKNFAFQYAGVILHPTAEKSTKINEICVLENKENIIRFIMDINFILYIALLLFNLPEIKIKLLKERKKKRK